SLSDRSPRISSVIRSRSTRTISCDGSQMAARQSSLGRSPLPPMSTQYHLSASPRTACLRLAECPKTCGTPSYSFSWMSRQRTPPNVDPPPRCGPIASTMLRDPPYSLGRNGEGGFVLIQSASARGSVLSTSPASGMYRICGCRPACVRSQPCASSASLSLPWPSTWLMTSTVSGGGEQYPPNMWRVSMTARSWFPQSTVSTSPSSAIRQHSRSPTMVCSPKCPRSPSWMTLAPRSCGRSCSRSARSLSACPCTSPMTRTWFILSVMARDCSTWHHVRVVLRLVVREGPDPHRDRPLVGAVHRPVAGLELVLEALPRERGHRAQPGRRRPHYDPDLAQATGRRHPRTSRSPS